LFERITAENVKKRLAIVLDNNVYSAPVIQEKIAGGEARITGSFTTEDARDLAIVLRAGALPAPVQILEERTVGPSLGTDSIRMGLLSMCVGGILVILFMAIYYKGSGVCGRFCPDSQHPAHRRRTGRIRCHAHPARHRRHHPDHRHGSGCQRA
jgi:preprotein translocase subunit SecD